MSRLDAVDVRVVALQEAVKVVGRLEDDVTEDRVLALAVRLESYLNRGVRVEPQ